ncbi:DUF2974 domain-containing protein [Sneathiella sp. P13V-1]|uniref:lipase family protein n=1 Tax=Sneathiella sp. P13V-1 TaxID=2697366 RepID=UPI00187B4888|nr:lipase family protein [Sneathiella sp. P13V-1]MBE7638237.1 DUF2974 domain-containing protein [Sneathiella sp. P13V-1]
MQPSPWLNSREIWKLVHKLNWSDSDYDIHKMYFLSLFSHLVYYKITVQEFAQFRRATVVPSFSFQEQIYNRDLDFEQIVRPLDVEILDIIENEYFIAIIFKIKDLKIISFRGTSNLFDWRINLDARGIDFYEGRFHHGFFSETIRTLKELSRSNYLKNGLIYLTGHSLGGALAGVMSALTTSSIKGNLVSVYTFGTPRFGNNKFSLPWQKPYCCIRKGDPVPNTPPIWLGYEDPEFLINTCGKPIDFDRGISEMNFVKLTLKQWRLEFFNDHSMEGYVEEILQKLRLTSNLL